MPAQALKEGIVMAKLEASNETAITMNLDFLRTLQ
jgi:hypothetical protein